LTENAYKEYEEELIQIFQEGIKLYRAGGTAWANYKEEHFIIIDKTIRIQ
jgi:hypothetical protein